MNTDTIRAIFLYWISLALSMAAVVQLETKVDLSNHQSSVMMIAILLPALSVLFGLRVWRRWKVVIVKEVSPREVINLVGEPFLDPVRGVLMNGISTSGGTFEVLIEPKWWHLFPRSAISKDGEKECAIFNAGYSSVLPGTEPTSLVMLKAKDLTVGFGARVRYNGCSDYLLTAHHVVKPHEKLNLCKSGYMVEDVDLAVTCGSDHDAVDFALIKVPPAVWSKLKVGVGKLEPMTKKTHVTVYGGSDSTRLLSSSGPAYKGKAGYAIIHEASTTKGWSGTPLYSGNTIVGVHTGSGKVGYSNRAVNVKLLLTAVSKFETIFSEISYGELDEDNYLLRNRDDFVEVEILGKGKFLLGDSSFLDITGKPLGWEKEKRARGEALWHDASDDDFYEDANFLADFYKDSKETVDDIMLEQFKLPAGGHNFKSCVATLIELASYEWKNLSESISSRGMPLADVGRSSCKFRETVRKELGADVTAASFEFPELQGYSWPDRGSKAERGSLLYQAGRFKPTPPPAKLYEAVVKLAPEYPETVPRACLRREQWDKEEIAKEAREIGQKKVNPKASPGVPLSILGKTNKEVLDRHGDLVYIAVAERICMLAEADLADAPDPVDLVKAGYCDPIRLFVKQEPHPLKKVVEGRFRLISSVSLVDQLVERLLFGPQNETEIDLWQSVPSKPGMGLSQPWQVSALWNDLEHKHKLSPAAEADISGFDWSVQSWEILADVCIRIDRGGFKGNLRKAALNRFKCFSNAVFQLSDGTLISQGLPGLMKSGSYCTSSTNSRIRCLMAKIIGAPWCIAMGDDSVEGYVEGAREMYDSLGHTCKDYIPCKADLDKLEEVNFCSHTIRKDSYYLQSWAKTLFRFLSQPEDVNELAVELKGCPEWPRISKYLRRIGRISDKTSEGEGKQNDRPQGEKIKEEIRSRDHHPAEPTEIWWETIPEPNDSGQEREDPYGFNSSHREIFPCNPL
nr:polyprotein [Subterranean clover mottle virus]